MKNFYRIEYTLINGHSSEIDIEAYNLFEALDLFRETKFHYSIKELIIKKLKV